MSEVKPEGTRQGWRALDKRLAWGGGQILREQDPRGLGLAIGANYYVTVLESVVQLTRY